jgi:hypothetical protein
MSLEGPNLEWRRLSDAVYRCLLADQHDRPRLDATAAERRTGERLLGDLASSRVPPHKPPALPEPCGIVWVGEAP